MAVEGIITLGIGSSPGGLYSFFTLGFALSGAGTTNAITPQLGIATADLTDFLTGGSASTPFLADGTVDADFLGEGGASTPFLGGGSGSSPMLGSGSVGR